MTVIDRCADAIRPLLRERSTTNVSHQDAKKVVRRMFEEARQPSEIVLRAMCELECRRRDCLAACSCQGHYIPHQKQRWEIAVSTILDEEEYEKGL